jgi:hypothetical protein
LTTWFIDSILVEDRLRVAMVPNKLHHHWQMSTNLSYFKASSWKAMMREIIRTLNAVKAFETTSIQHMASYKTKELFHSTTTARINTQTLDHTPAHLHQMGKNINEYYT